MHKPLLHRAVLLKIVIQIIVCVHHLLLYQAVAHLSTPLCSAGAFQFRVKIGRSPHSGKGLAKVRLANHSLTLSRNAGLP